MRYTVETGMDRTKYKHFETKELAYKEVKRLCGGTMPQLTYTSHQGVERYPDSLDNVISVVPDR